MVRVGKVSFDLELHLDAELLVHEQGPVRRPVSGGAGGAEEGGGHTTVWYRDQLDSVYAQVLEDLKGHGVTVTTIDAAPFQAMVDPVYAKFGAEWGEDFVAEIRNAAGG